MTFGERITQQRKAKKWSQEDLATPVGTSAPIIGRYERNEIKPSVDVAAKIAAALGVTLDYLVTGTEQVLDEKNLQRLQDIQALDSTDKMHILYALDALIRDSKTRKAYGK